MATVPHVNAWAGHTKYHADGFLFDWVYNASNYTKDNDAIQKYLSTERKLGIHLQRQPNFYAKMSQMQKT